MPPLVQIPLFAMGVCVGVVWHEAGHGVAGWLVGKPVRVMNFGAGRPIWIGRWPRPLVVVRPNLFYGHVVTLWRPRQSVLAGVVSALGGMAGNCVLFALLALAAISWPGWSAYCATLGGAQVFLILCSLVPFEGRFEGLAVRSDGALLFRLLRRGRSERFVGAYREAIAILFPEAAPRAVPTAASAEAMFAVGRRDAASTDPLRGYWTDCLRRLLASDGLSDYERLFVLERLVSGALIQRRGDVPAGDIDGWSLEMVRLFDEPGFRVTRGGALVLLGRAGEAKALLEPLLLQDMSAINLVGCNVFLAQAMAALGEMPASDDYAAAARELAVGDATAQAMVETMLGFRGRRVG